MYNACLFTQAMRKPVCPTKELRRLYEREKLSVREVGLRVGISRQAVFERLSNAGQKFRPREPKPPPVDARNSRRDGRNNSSAAWRIGNMRNSESQTRRALHSPSSAQNLAAVFVVSTHDLAKDFDSDDSGRPARLSECLGLQRH